MSQQFSLSVKAALDSLLPVAGFAATERSVNEVYKHVLIKSTGESVYAIGCNGAQSILRTLPTQQMFSDAFELCVDGTKLRAILQGFKDSPDKEMTLTWEAGGSSAAVQVGRTKLVLAMIAPEGFPYPEKLVNPNFEIVLKSSVLINALRATNHAIGNRDVRAYLNGCHIKFAGGMFSVTGTDGHRISRVNHGVQLGEQSCGEGIIPSRCLDLICTSMDKESDVRVRMSQGMIELTSAGNQLRSTLIDGQFPDTTHFFGDAVRLLDCKKSELMQAIGRLRATVYEKLPSLTIELAGKDELKLATLDESKQESGVDFISAAVRADTIPVLSLNISYLSDCLAEIADDEVSLSVLPNNSVRIASLKDSSFHGVIAQLRR